MSKLESRIEKSLMCHPGIPLDPKFYHNCLGIPMSTVTTKSFRDYVRRVHARGAIIPLYYCMYVVNSGDMLNE